MDLTPQVGCDKINSQMIITDINFNKSGLSAGRNGGSCLSEPRVFGEVRWKRKNSE
ncbi:MAG: hypothetical protein PUC05_08805 [Firmicutes bacterium]|nr:hypothetical protein [Bacillota bacterium]